MTKSISPRVVIIGAGTGGLCLAQGLRRAGFTNVAVFERDRTRRDGLQGYRVGISPDGSRALHACLPPELYATFVATCARPPRSFSMLDQHLHPLLEVTEKDGLNLGSDPVESEKSVSRMTLRQVLLTGLEDIVHFDKKFSHYQVRADQSVEAFFEDGTSVIADLLVGADGSNSRVRKQLLPHAQLADTGIVGIGGKVLLTEEVKALIAPPLWNGVTLIFGPNGYSWVSHTMEFAWRDGRPKAGIGRTEAELIESWPGLLFDNTSDYFMWGFSGARQRLPVDPLGLDGAQLIDLVLRLTPDWHPNLRRLVALSDASATFPIAIRTSLPVDTWPTGPVTVLGDAIHTMTPGRGVGANTALLDALLLCRQLDAVRDARLSQTQAVAAYETAMRACGYEAVKASLAQMTSDALVHHPVWGAPALVMMKTMLRTVNALPPLKRKFAQSQNQLRDRQKHAALEGAGLEVPRAAELAAA
ncbi:MAG TPA: NAD(P)/FAD-dependent oxidoreductase [Chloroflexota bacterium]|nr:NAD(P)/FAD-dependent oxidoreductase [Chloroflexota bacterium]